MQCAETSIYFVLKQLKIAFCVDNFRTSLKVNTKLFNAQMRIFFYFF